MIQSQQSLLDQLHELRVLANRKGLYDAADFLTEYLREHEGLSDRREKPRQNG